MLRKCRSEINVDKVTSNQTNSHICMGTWVALMKKNIYIYMPSVRACAIPLTHTNHNPDEGSNPSIWASPQSYFGPPFLHKSKHSHQRRVTARSHAREPRPRHAKALHERYAERKEGGGKGHPALLNSDQTFSLETFPIKREMTRLCSSKDAKAPNQVALTIQWMYRVNWSDAHL